MNTNDKNVHVLKQAAEYILSGKSEEAGAIINEQYPFVPAKSLEFPEMPAIASGEDSPRIIESYPKSTK